MNNFKISVDSNLAQFIALMVILIFGGALAFSYREMSSMRRDLYAVRDDFYGAGYYTDIKLGESQAEYDVISQSTKSLRVLQNDELKFAITASPDDAVYEPKNVRVMEVKIKNTSATILSYYDNLGIVGSDGIVQHPVQVHPDDDQNDERLLSSYGSFEIVPGGEATVFLYFLDGGTEITELYDMMTSSTVQL